MSESTKRWLVLGSALLACLGLILAIYRLRPTYWAYSSVRVQPLTNMVPARALQGPFQRQVRKAVPSVHRLTISPSFATPAAARAWFTNQTASGPIMPLSAELRIMALGPSPAKAQVAANEAAARLCSFLTQQYGGSVTIVSNADVPGRYWFPSEVGLQIERLLER